MASVMEYMQFATRVYDASDNNRIGVPTGWTELNWESDQGCGDKISSLFKSYHLYCHPALLSESNKVGN